MYNTYLMMISVYVSVCVANFVLLFEPASKQWSAIDIFDWLGFLSVLLMKTRFDCKWQDLFDPDKEEYTEFFGQPQCRAVMTPTRFERIRKYAYAEVNLQYPKPV